MVSEAHVREDELACRTKTTVDILSDLTCVPWVNRSTGLPLQDEVSRAIHVLDYRSHGPDALLDREDYESVAKRRALALGILGGGQ